MAAKSVAEKVAKKVVRMVAKWADVKVFWKAARLVGWKVAQVAVLKVVEMFGMMVERSAYPQVAVKVF